MKLTLLLFLLYICGNTLVYAAPAQVIVIRHGEKPPVGDNLTLKGRERAAALVPYFLYTKALTSFGTPVAIYAEGTTTTTPTRAMETCNPLAEQLGLKLLSQYTRNQYPAMVQEVLKNPQYNGKTVLICWEHKHIPDIVSALGVQPKMSAWPGKVYDRTLLITYKPDGTVASFKNIPQQLLFGDSPQ